MDEALQDADNVVELIDQTEAALSTGTQEEKENAGAAALAKMKYAGKQALALSATSGGRAQAVLNESLARLQSLYERQAPLLCGLPPEIPPVPFDEWLARGR
jgi:hypothetical protein